MMMRKEHDEEGTLEERGYRAYLVRLWRARRGERVVWRASVEDAHTHERWAFADLAALCAFLRAETEGPGSGRGEGG
jgi:hypothetical protein